MIQPRNDVQERFLKVCDKLFAPKILCTQECKRE
jgi:hypothetical protein